MVALKSRRRTTTLPWGGNMDNYIIRVYRRGRHKSDEISGLVEQVGSSQRRPFQTLRGLISIVRQLVGGENRHSGNVTSMEPDEKREVVNNK